MKKSLELLVIEAINSDPEFKFKFSYWINKRKKTPDHDWLFTNLVKALGESKVRKAIKEEIKNEI